MDSILDVFIDVCGKQGTCPCFEQTSEQRSYRNVTHDISNVLTFSLYYSYVHQHFLPHKRKKTENLRI
jgi:hypothetical protein